MSATARPYIMAAAALAASGAITATSVAPTPAEVHVANPAVRLIADGDSMLNIPFNLFQDIVNIPSTEIQAINVLAASLFFAGNWWTPSATNIWGTDPGDLGHYIAILGMFIPFPEISGLGQPAIDPVADAAGTAGLAQQIALLAAAELPTSASCDADWCAPMVPATPITGSTGIDRNIWFYSMMSGQQHFPLFDNWFKVPMSDLTNGITFDENTVPEGLANPSMGVGPGGAVLADDVYGFEGTHPGPNGENLMPWAGIDFKFDPAAPFENYYNSLLAPPDFNNFHFPTLTDFIYAMQSLHAGSVVAFDPYVPGSPACGGACDLPPSQTMQGLVEAIGNAFPGNTYIDHWLELVNTPNPNPGMEDTTTGMTNAATPHQIQNTILLLQGLPEQRGWWFDFGNPLPSDPPTTGPMAVDTPEPVSVDPALQNLIQFMQDSGIQSFMQQWADATGYVPLDYTTGTTAAAGDSLAALDASYLMNFADPWSWLTDLLSGSFF